jgi:hypothetical protein
LLDTTGRLDVILALLVHIAEYGMGGLSMPAAMLEVSSSTIERRRIALHTAGLIRSLERTLVAEISPRGRAVLDILARLDHERTSGKITPELAYILSLLKVPRGTCLRPAGTMTVKMMLPSVLRYLTWLPRWETNAKPSRSRALTIC